MEFKSLNFKREQKSIKRNKEDLSKNEQLNKLKLEAESKICEALESNEKVMIQVDESVLIDFIELLDYLTNLYDYRQIDKTKFIFYNKELLI